MDKINMYGLNKELTNYFNWKRHELKSDSHVPEIFCQIKVFPSLVQKNTVVCLVFKNENKWILKL